MRREYDFTGGTRGKHYKHYRQGHSVRVEQANGLIVEHHFSVKDGAVILDPDVREYFPDAKSVNRALRSLIALVPSKAARIVKGTRQS